MSVKHVLLYVAIAVVGAVLARKVKVVGDTLAKVGL